MDGLFPAFGSLRWNNFHYFNNYLFSVIRREQDGERDIGHVPTLKELTVCGGGGEEWGKILVQ